MDAKVAYPQSLRGFCQNAVHKYAACLVWGENKRWVGCGGWQDGEGCHGDQQQPQHGGHAAQGTGRMSGMFGGRGGEGRWREGEGMQCDIPVARLRPRRRVTSNCPLDPLGHRLFTKCTDQFDGLGWRAGCGGRTPLPVLHTAGPLTWIG